MLDELLKEKGEIGNIATAVACLAPSPALLIFVCRPDIFAKFDTFHLLLLITGVGFGVLLATSIFVDLVTSSTDRRSQRICDRDSMPYVKKDERAYWSMFSIAAGLANLVLLGLTAWAYWHQIQLGASLVAAVIWIVGLGIPIALFNSIWPIDWTNPPKGQRLNREEAKAAVSEKRAG